MGRGRGTGGEEDLGEARLGADPYAALPTEHPLRKQLELFDDAGKLIGGWTCDGGAAALSRLLDKAGIEHEPVVGIYHWPKERWPLRWRDVGEPEDPGEVDDEPEHHHWVEVDGYLIDPNGEWREEPRVQSLDEALKPLNPDDRWSPPRYQRSSKREVLEWSPWYEPPSDEDWESGYEGELIIPDTPDARDHKGWKALGLI